MKLITDPLKKIQIKRKEAHNKASQYLPALNHNITIFSLIAEGNKMDWVKHYLFFKCLLDNCKNPKEKRMVSNVARSTMPNINYPEPFLNHLFKSLY
jgi:hypothetical protein